MARDADVIVVGAGIAGAMIADGLARAGVNVLLLESGPVQDRQAAVTDYRQSPVRVPEAAYPPVEYAPRPTVADLNAYYVQGGPDDFKSTYERRSGGSTWHWLGTALRLVPNDFRMRSTYGVAVDWPISYEDLEPWYTKAENAIGVAGPPDAGLLISPRSGPYPMPALPQSYLDGIVARGAERVGLIVGPTPQARNSVQRDGRPACCGSSSCVPICPIGAKYDATVHVKKATAAGARLITSAVVVDVQVQPDAAQVTYRPSGGDPVTVTSRTVVLAANAIETPKLMLMSTSDSQPQGLGNANDQVGRYLMDHPIQLSWAVAPEPVYPYRGPLSTSGIDSVRDGAFRSSRGAFRVEIQNPGWSYPLGDPSAQARAWTDDNSPGPQAFRRFRANLLRQVCLTGASEPMPDPANRVRLAGETDAIGVPRPLLDFRPGEYSTRSRAEARRLFSRIFRAMGCTQQYHRDTYEGAGHLMGTTRMGNNPRTSVVDRNLRLHGHPNCFVVGAGAFPTVGTANPTLTVAALALRAVDPIRTSLSE
ncbi:MAG: GMC family oxidoreductase [Miltoncostaeaceae bacterium]